MLILSLVLYSLFCDCMSDDLLPLIHCVWKSFVHRFTDEEPLVTIKVSPWLLLTDCSFIFYVSTIEHLWCRRLSVFRSVRPWVSEWVSLCVPKTVNIRSMNTLHAKNHSAHYVKVKSWLHLFLEKRSEWKFWWERKKRKISASLVTVECLRLRVRHKYLN